MKKNVHSSLIILGSLFISVPLAITLFDEQKEFPLHNTQHLLFYDHSNPTHPCGLKLGEIIRSRYRFVNKAKLYYAPSSPHAVGPDEITLVPGKHQSTEIALIVSHRPDVYLLSGLHESVPLRFGLPNYCKPTDKWKFAVLSTEVDTSGLSTSNLIVINLVMIFSMTVMALYRKVKSDKKFSTGKKHS